MKIKNKFWIKNTKNAENQQKLRLRVSHRHSEFDTLLCLGSTTVNKVFLNAPLRKQFHIVGSGSGITFPKERPELQLA